MVGYFILTSQPTLALVLFCYAGVTDLVDGYIARRYALQTVVGTVIDPMADKALMTISVVALAVQGGIPVWLASLILLRDVGLAISALYYRWISLPPPKTMARYWDFSLPSAEVRPTEISKVNTFLQLLLVGSAMALPVLSPAVVEAWRLGLGFQGFQYVAVLPHHTYRWTDRSNTSPDRYLVAATTVWSGASYVYSKDAVKILTHEEIERRTAEKEKTKKEDRLGP